MQNPLRPYNSTVTRKLTLSFILVFVFGFGYSQKVSYKTNADTIKIGEQIDYTIEVEDISSKDFVVFPKDQTFVPLEMVEDYKIDTTQPEVKSFKLIKLYKLTQFDSGTYSVPPQLVKINDKAFYTDTLTVRINDVVLDTTQQKLFPIKPSIGVEKPFRIPCWFWWTIGIIGVLGIIAFLLFKFKKKRDEAKKRVPPFQQAMIYLKELDKSSALESRNFKEYITELTNISRRYLEEKLEIRALEYTSNELISELIFRKEKKKLALKDGILADYEKILKRADLAKFAKSKPDLITLKSDRKQIEIFLKNVQSAIPQITEEEKKKDKAFQEALAKKRRKQKWIVGIILGAVLIIAVVSAVIATKGYAYVKDNIFGNPTKELLEGDWITSDYGIPPMSMTTPQVLVRGDYELPESLKQNVADSEMYSSGSMYQSLYILLNQIRFKEAQEVNLDAVVDGIYTDFEERGAYNIVTKSEEFETIGGVKGKKVFGSFAIENPITKSDIRKEYQILNFGKGGFQQIIIIHEGDDEYGESITKRIINAVEFKSLEE
jgi:hypothetical protein